MHNSFKNIKFILYVNSITLPFTFFSVLAMLSIEYKGINESNSYLTMMIISASFVYFFFLQNIFNRSKFFVSELIFYLLPLFIIFNGIIALFIFNVPCEKSIYQFIIFVIPAIIFGVEIARSGNIYMILPLFLFSAFLNTVGFVSVIPKMLTIPTNELITFYGGGHYQAFSYSVSFAYLIVFIYYLFYYHNRNWKKTVFFSIIFFIHIIGIVLSGGRGGLIVIIFGTLFSLYMRYSVWRVFKKVIFFSLFVSLLGLLIFSFLGEYKERVIESSDRLFSYITISGISMDQTSNRDILYDEAIKTVLKEPLFGHGIFRYLLQTNGSYPHNFLLEVLLQGGFIYLFFWIFILIVFLIRLKTLFKTSRTHFLIISTITYSFIQLLFSGTYLLEPLFWFSLAYVFTASSRILVNFRTV